MGTPGRKMTTLPKPDPTEHGQESFFVSGDLSSRGNRFPLYILHYQLATWLGDPPHGAEYVRVFWILSERKRIFFTLMCFCLCFFPAHKRHFDIEHPAPIFGRQHLYWEHFEPGFKAVRA